MNSTFSNKDIVSGKYHIEFFLRGTEYFEEYRAKLGNNYYLLKLFNSSRLNRYSFVDGELLEAQILKELKNSNTIKLLDAGETIKNNQKFHFLIFEFVSGESLQEKLTRDGSLSEYAAIPLILELVNSINECHTRTRPIIHNNVNLDSIYLDYSAATERAILGGFEHARYIDAKSNSVELSYLNPFYTAPEQYNGIFTPQSDVFSVGALLYQMLLGVPPWHVSLPNFKNSKEAYLDLIHEKRNEKLTFFTSHFDELEDSHLKETLKKALSLDIASRFRNVEELGEALSRKVVLNTPLFEQAPIAATTRQKKVREGAGFSAIAGMNDLKELLNNNVIRALNEPELYNSYGISIPNGMLLYGPPGCGKTFISKRFAEEVGFNFVELKPSDINRKHINETEENISLIFKAAIENAPSIIFIDEMDAVVPNRDDKNLHQMQASSVNELLVQMSNCSENGIFVIAASNRPEKIDPAILRTGRLDKSIYLPPPDYEARLAMFKLYLKDRPVDIGFDYELIASSTENYVSSDIKFLVDEASRQALNDLARVTTKLFLNTIDQTQPSVSLDELKKYEALKAKFEDKKGNLPTKNKPSIGFINTN